MDVDDDDDGADDNDGADIYIMMQCPLWPNDDDSAGDHSHDGDDR